LTVWCCCGCFVRCPQLLGGVTSTAVAPEEVSIDNITPGGDGTAEASGGASAVEASTPVRVSDMDAPIEEDVRVGVGLSANWLCDVA